MDEQLIEVQLQDGSSTKVSVFEKSRNDGPVIILFSAMGTAASYYHPFAKALAEKGFTAIAADLRGLGHSSVRPGRKCDFGFNEMLELDYKGILEKAHLLFPGKKKFILGHSLGGILGSLYLSKYPGDADGIILTAACNIHYKGWSGFGKWRILLGTQFFNVASSILGYHAGNKLGFGGKGARGVIKDWSYTARTGKYSVKSSEHDFEKNLREINPKVLAISFSRDEFSPRKAVENLLAKFNPSSDITRKHLTDIGSTNKPYSHYNWVKNNEEVIELIAGWTVTALRDGVSPLRGNTKG